ncbi:2-oxoglutarate-dependent dioxygenase 19-like [Salvia splendens]|uniref:2-oxoglutarate-dependent dioxygenase 19-like n=1 Tax=Salvia splendens TaxID=180675 RepID=UPI001C253C2E|nr:2-oxoglutarate-dependent dioxygenase 19-like [Salvia splendens]
MASNSVDQPLEFERSIKAIADSSNLEAVPSKFNIANDYTALPSDSIPLLDFSSLISADPHQRTKAVQDLAEASRVWGFFILVNHGIPESLMKDAIAAVRDFFNLPESEKKQYESKSVLDSIQCGNLTLVNTSNQSFTFWREYLRLRVHPDFHCPHHPQHLREIVMDYSKKIRELYMKIMEAAVEYLELDKHYVDQVLKMDSMAQMVVGNCYPACPQPDKAIGLPPHTDPGLLTFLINNGVEGLQIEHDGKWFNVQSPPNSILVNVDDHFEILTNGRFKSLKHRAVVNKERERISLVVLNTPAWDAIVGPAAPLVDKDGSALYHSMEYKQYLETSIAQSRLGGKSFFEQQLIIQDI